MSGLQAVGAAARIEIRVINMDHLQDYRENGFKEVEGWLESYHLDFLSIVHGIQKKSSISGNIAEIGVFHGKFLLALASLLEPGAKVTALDVFDDQSKNIDGAGAGNLEILKNNIENYGRKEIDYDFVKCDSSAITLADKVRLINERGPFRLFSVDGCHTAEHTLNDLRTAEDCIMSGGVIILDDYLQPHWPGVTQAASLFCSGAPKTLPFLYAHHKLWFVGIGWHEEYFQETYLALNGRENARIVTMFGAKVVALYP